MKYFGQKTNQEKYLEYVNDWLTIERMADNYGLTIPELTEIIDKGRIDHENSLIKNKTMKNSFYNLFRMYSNCTINSSVLLSQLFSMEEDMGEVLMFRFGNSTILWSINDISDTIYGYQKDNKKLLNELIETAVNENSLTIE